MGWHCLSSRIQGGLKATRRSLGTAHLGLIKWSDVQFIVCNQMLKNLDLNLLPVFDSLIRTGSVTRSAVDLGLTQSALSHALRRLRDYFQDPLFVRTRGRLLPTTRALELEAVIVSMMNCARTHLVAGAGFDASQSSRKFRVSMSDMSAAFFMPRLVREMRALAPSSSLQICCVPSHQISESLESGDIDLAVTTARIQTEGLYQQQVVAQELVCIVASSNPAVESGMDLSTYLNASHIGISPHGQDVDFFEWMATDLGLRRRFALVVNSFLVLPSLIPETDLIATVPRCLPDLYSSAFDIKALPMPIPVPAPTLRQVWHPRFHADPGHVWFRNLMFTLFE